MPRPAKLIAPSHDSLVGRIAWLMHKVWQGRQVDMAQAIGVHQATISNILRGKRPPGREFVGLLAAHPLINEHWLREGAGNPLAAASSLDDGDFALPVARRLFSGMPDDNADSLQSYLYPVIRRFHRRSRYWIEVSADNPWRKAEGSRVVADSKVLVEPDRQQWPNNGRCRLCIVQIADEGFGYAAVPSGTPWEGALTVQDFEFVGKEGAQTDGVERISGRRLRAISLSGGDVQPTIAVKILAVAIICVHEL